MEGDLDRQLLPLRERIDKIDVSLIDLLNQRALVAIEIGAAKRRLGIPTFRPEREIKVIEGVKRAGRGPLTNDHITSIWREIISASRSLEGPKSIAYLGPEGTFSEQATIDYFGNSINRVPKTSIDAVCNAIENREVDFAVLPIENSIQGIIPNTFDFLLQTTSSICGEISIPIHHHLICGDMTSKLSAIYRVYAHAQALLQCQYWLGKNLPNADLISVSSNAEGARKAALEEGAAAIASKRALEYYSLRILVSMIQDDSHNQTRFFVLGRSPVSRLDGVSYKTSLVLSVNSEIHAMLRKIFTSFSRDDILIERFELRPMHGNKDWNHCFYIDINGHFDDPKISSVLLDLKDHASFFKLLGSYASTS